MIITSFQAHSEIIKTTKSDVKIKSVSLNTSKSTSTVDDQNLNVRNWHNAKIRIKFCPIFSKNLGLLKKWSRLVQISD